MYEIKTKRLLLRPLTMDDLKTTHIYSSDEENTKYMFFLPNKSINDTYDFLKRVTDEWQKKSPNFYEFAIVLNGRHIGAVSLYLDAEHKIGEIGWIIDKHYHKNGFAFEAASALKDFAFSKLQLKKIVAHCDYRNTASQNLMKKIGMTLEDDSSTRTYPQTGETVKELMYSLTH